VHLTRDKQLGTWTDYVDGNFLDCWFDTPELALIDAEKHLGIYVPKDAAEIEAAFRAELKALLAKYGAEIEAEDHYPGYAECGEDIRMTVTVASVYDDAGERTREGCDIDLGDCFDGKES